MTNKSIYSQTLALAGVLQCAYLVDQIARSGNCQAECFNTSVNSLFKFDADSTDAVYGGISGVKLGLQVISDSFSGRNRADFRAIIRYSLGILYLQKKLSSDMDSLSIIRNRLEHTALKAEHFSDDPNSTAASLASIYQDTISTYKYRINISGSAQALQNPNNANRIRALLLAGIRSAVLWRQSGGARWRLVFQRGKILNTSRELLKQI